MSEDTFLSILALAGSVGALSLAVCGVALAVQAVIEVHGSYKRWRKEP